MTFNREDYAEIELSTVIKDLAAGPFGSNLKVECFVEQGFPIIDGANLKGYTVTDNVTKFVTKEKAYSLHRSIARRGDVVVTISGTLGQIAYIPENSQYEEYLVSQRQFRVEFDTTKVSVPFLVYYFHTYEGQQKILSFANQVGVPALAQPLKNFRQIKMRMPPLQVQHKISKIIGAIEEKRGINDAINNNLQQQAQALFKAWFVDYIPWNGKCPDWEQGTLSDYVTVKRGGSPRPIQDYLSDSGYRWLKISDVTSLQTPFITSIAEHIKESGINKTVLLKSGCLVLSNSATPGIPKILDLDSCIHDGWLYFPQSQFSNEFLYLLFLHIRPSLVALGNGSVFTNLKTDILKAYSINKPPIEVLNAFDEIIKPIFTTILHNTREINRLTALRDTLLPKLMSGEIDVSDVEI